MRIMGSPLLFLFILHAMTAGAVHTQRLGTSSQRSLRFSNATVDSTAANTFSDQGAKSKDDHKITPSKKESLVVRNDGGNDVLDVTINFSKDGITVTKSGETLDIPTTGENHHEIHSRSENNADNENGNNPEQKEAGKGSTESTQHINLGSMPSKPDLPPPPKAEDAERINMKSNEPAEITPCFKKGMHEPGPGCPEPKIVAEAKDVTPKDGKTMPCYHDESGHIKGRGCYTPDIKSTAKDVTPKEKISSADAKDFFKRFDYDNDNELSPGELDKLVRATQDSSQENLLSKEFGEKNVNFPSFFSALNKYYSGSSNIADEGP